MFYYFLYLSLSPKIIFILIYFFWFLPLPLPHQLWKIYSFIETQLLHVTSSSVWLRGKFYLVNRRYIECTWRWAVCPVLIQGVCFHGNQPFPDKECSREPFCSHTHAEPWLLHVFSCVGHWLLCQAMQGEKKD